MDWICLAQDTNRSQVFVNMLMDMVHKMLGPSWLAEHLLASQEGLCSTELVIQLQMLL
jgi:hypothetical protein